VGQVDAFCGAALNGKTKGICGPAAFPARPMSSWLQAAPLNSSEAMLIAAWGVLQKVVEREKEVASLLGNPAAAVSFQGTRDPLVSNNVD
jgi:hypothetical protein